MSGPQARGASLKARLSRLEAAFVPRPEATAPAPTHRVLTPRAREAAARSLARRLPPDLQAQLLEGQDCAPKLERLLTAARLDPARPTTPEDALEAYRRAFGSLGPNESSP